ncbi:MAG TPA: polysaccharide deacetylase family protein, partial [Micromonosporaceae bacterium]
MNRRESLRAVVACGVAAAGLTGCTTRGGATPTTTGHTAVPAGSAPAAPGGHHVTLPPEVTHGPRDRPVVALTFHGQGEPAMVTQLLAELEAGGARVTVLAVGSWLAAHPSMARRILDGGHELGNHTLHHRAIGQMSAAQAYTEINGCAEVLSRLTGSIGRWFRPSQTRHADAVIRTQSRRAGYATCLSYDVDSLDYTDPPAARVVATTLEAVRAGSIVSMHCGHAVTVAAIGPILDGLRRRGLRAMT